MEFPGDIDINEIFSVTDKTFEALALRIFLFQYRHNEVYRQFCDIIKCDPYTIKEARQIPFLPIRFYKSKEIKTTAFKPEVIFESSGTTGMISSRHLVKNISFYEQSFLKGFLLFYGRISRYCVIGLLPSYLERSGSSLVYMTDKLIEGSENPSSGFYLYEFKKLHEVLLQQEALGNPTILIGVTYALLDFAAEFPMQLKHTIVMETGGMKGRRKELTRSEVHDTLKKQLGVKAVHSEYGMTELLSQAYSEDSGMFSSPPWMQVLIRREDDPFDVYSRWNISDPITGAGNIIDLANLYSCSFIATDDMIRLYRRGNFEVLGRIDNSDIRGCGLMIM